MFVEHLQPAQILKFLKTSEDYKYASTVRLSEGACIDGIILFTVEFSKEPKRYVSTAVTATDTEIFFRKDEKWIKYLYSVFGENYKVWYKEQQRREFERLFEDSVK